MDWPKWLKWFYDIMDDFKKDDSIYTYGNFSVPSVATVGKNYKRIDTVQGNVLHCISIPAGVTCKIRFNKETNDPEDFIAGRKFKTPYRILFLQITGSSATDIQFVNGQAYEVDDASQNLAAINQTTPGKTNAVTNVAGLDMMRYIDPVTGAEYNYNNQNFINSTPVGAPTDQPVWGYNHFPNPGVNPVLELRVDGRPNVEIWVKSITPGATYRVYSYEDPIFGATFERLVGTYTTALVTGEARKLFVNAYRWIKVELVETAPPNGISQIEIVASR